MDHYVPWAIVYLQYVGPSLGPEHAARAHYVGWTYGMRIEVAPALPGEALVARPSWREREVRAGR